MLKQINKLINWKKICLRITIFCQMMAYRDSNPTFEIYLCQVQLLTIFFYFLYFFLQHIHSYIHLNSGLPHSKSGRTTIWATPQPIWSTPHPLSYAPRFLLFSHQYFFLVEGYCTLCTVVVVGKGSKKTAHVLQCPLRPVHFTRNVRDLRVHVLVYLLCCKLT